MIEQLEARQLLASIITMQAEDFTAGDYYDTTPTNLLGAYRNTPVDVGPTKDVGGGYLIGHIRASEYVGYSITVPESGKYDIQFRVSAATGYGGKFHLEVNGTDRTQSINLNPTGGWDTWTTVTKSDVTLYAGKQNFRVVFDSANKSGNDIGGLNWFKLVPKSTTPTPTPTDFTWPTTSQWKAAASSPIARIECYSFSYNNKLYVLGGWKNSALESTKRVDVYDPATNKWTRLADMQAPETHAGYAIDSSKGYAYFVAGHRGTYPSTPSDQLWRWKIGTSEWTLLSAKLPKKIGGNTAAIVSGKLHTFGGSAADRVTNVAEHYAIDLSNIYAGFKKLAPLPYPRDHLSSAVINGKIYILNGEYGHSKYHDHQKYVHVYDPATDTFKRLADSPYARSHAEATTFTWNGKIYMGGGQMYPQVSTDVMAMFDPATNKWKTLSKLPAKRQGAVLMRVGNYLVYTVGGSYTEKPHMNTWVYKIA